MRLFGFHRCWFCSALASLDSIHRLVFLIAGCLNQDKKAARDVKGKGQSSGFSFDGEGLYYNLFSIV